MNTLSGKNFLRNGVLLAAILLTGAGCAHIMGGGTQAGTLTGAQEVPPNASSASGVSSIEVSADKSVHGSVTYTGLTATAAHIHAAGAGVNGAVIIPLTQSAPNACSVPPGAMLSDSQYNDYLAGKLYVNVHSADYPGGEIRLQLLPR